MSASVEKHAPAKINLLLNVLGRRQDGFHEVETILHPIPVFDTLTLERGGTGIRFTCNDTRLKNDSSNLVVRAAIAFFDAAKITPCVSIHLEKRIPLAAGLGGGSSDAAATLLGLNELFEMPLTRAELERLAAGLGADVTFFLYGAPAVATGRGEQIRPVGQFDCLKGMHLFVVYPGFGVSTAWAYHQLARFPHALRGVPGRAQKLVELLHAAELGRASAEFYNALETPVFHKYPVLALYKEFLIATGAVAALMSGSGSSVFAIFDSAEHVKSAEAQFTQKFGSAGWTAVLQL
ncbi:MAG: 4-(cytidine 5'-diphospho)-2-C-methyl-D-erythritol kinase [Verrucomicrobiales bacterium]|nr:4-(cytidine 5'-diphospho)-2-C-methyl-D-erythritol kinase [Verrucomicrobiales bacterium]